MDVVPLHAPPLPPPPHDPPPLALADGPHHYGKIEVWTPHLGNFIAVSMHVLGTHAQTVFTILAVTLADCKDSRRKPIDQLMYDVESSLVSARPSDTCVARFDRLLALCDRHGRCGGSMDGREVVACMMIPATWQPKQLRHCYTFNACLESCMVHICTALRDISISQADQHHNTSLHA